MPLRRWRSRALGGPEWLEPRVLLSGIADSAELNYSQPIAGDDYYWTPADTPLHVPAPGLLENDYDPSGHWLEAVNLYGNLELEHGTLEMDAWRNDGSFDYYPYASHNGRDTFTYYCMDPDGWIVEATVTIDVGIFNRVPFVADPMEDVIVEQGSPDTIVDLAAVFDDLDLPNGDQLTYSVTVSPPILPIAEEVSESSYEYILSNTDPERSLFTHTGDDRGLGSVQHDLAGDNIYNYFESLGLITSRDIIPEVEDLGGTYVFDPPLVNVIGVKLGETYPEDVYLVGAHYDSVSNPGADDNASGVAGVMEIARVLSAHTFDSTLVFVAFDGEEQGLFGSLHYVEFHDSDHNIPGFTSQILGMVNLDMIAYNQSGDDHNVVSILDGDGVSNVKPNLISAISSYSGGVTARDEGSTSLSDHFYFDFFGIDAAMAIESAMGSVTENPYYHAGTDAVDTPGYIDYAYATKITRGVAGYLAQAAKPLGQVDLLTASLTGNQLTLDYDPTEFGGAVVTVRATDSEGLIVEDSFSVLVHPTLGNEATVAGRHIFYDNSYWDGNTAGFNMRQAHNGAGGPHDRGDDDAIAPDKSALLPGQTATFVNYTSYSRGINGIMIDIADLADPASLSVSDFEFRVGNNNNPASWPLLALDPSLITIAVRAGANAAGSDRVTVIFPDGAVKKTWLQVTVKATAATGLAAPDVHYWGNAIGDSGNSADDTAVNVADQLGARANPHTLLTPAPIDDAYDYNRDKQVNVQDELIARSNPSTLLTDLNLIDLTGYGSGEGEAGGGKLAAGGELWVPRDGFAQRDLLADSRALSFSAETTATLTSLDQHSPELPWLPGTWDSARRVTSTSTPLTRETTWRQQRSNARQLDVVQAWDLDVTSQLQVGRLDDPDQRAARARRIRWASEGQPDDELCPRDQAFAEWGQF